MLITFAIAVILIWLYVRLDYRSTITRQMSAHLPVAERREKMRLLRVGDSEQRVIEVVKHPTIIDGNWWVYPNEPDAVANDIIIFKDKEIEHIGML